MNEAKVKDRLFVAALSDKEYMKLRTDVAVKGLKLKAWVAQAIRDKLKKLEVE